MAELSLFKTLARGLSVKGLPSGISSVDNSRAWWPLIREPFTGAWQRNLEVTVDTALNNPVQFRCVTLIASDIAKLRCRVVAEGSNGVRAPVYDPIISPLLEKPNGYENRIQFFSSWMLSKLVHGNTYTLLQRDGAGRIVAMYVLDPTRVRPAVAADGSVWYQLSQDNLARVGEQLVVPASEIIHDRWNCLFHPLVGLSPIYANGVTALQGNEIQKTSTLFFKNGSKPGGILTHPDFLDEDKAKLYKERWEANYGGDNQGRIAVLGNGLKYESIAVSSSDSQLIEQLKWSGETICGTYGVPAYMAGVGAAPLNNNVATLNQLYYSQCLQPRIEEMEECLVVGLGMLAPRNGVRYRAEWDLSDLIKMDPASQLKTLSEGVLGGIITPNEARLSVNRESVEGGDSVYLQQQNFSLEALARRDSPAEDGAADVQKEALNGAQVTALQSLVMAAASGEIPASSVEAIIAAAFPLMSPAEVQNIIAPLEAAQPPPPAPAPEPQVANDFSALSRAVAARGWEKRFGAANAG